MFATTRLTLLFCLCLIFLPHFPPSSKKEHPPNNKTIIRQIFLIFRHFLHQHYIIIFLLSKCFCTFIYIYFISKTKQKCNIFVLFLSGIISVNINLYTKQFLHQKNTRKGVFVFLVFIYQFIRTMISLYNIL